jgi:plasmid stability protein
MGIEYVTTNVRLPKEMHRALKWRAVEENTSMAALVRESIARYLVEEQTEAVLSEEKPISDPIFQLGSLTAESEVIQGDRPTNGAVQHDRDIYEREYERWHAKKDE